MMKILVTLGTTSFDGLLKALDQEYKGVDIRFQIGSSGFIPKCGKTTKFIENIKEAYKSYDIIITHAGAGSVYHMLENNLRCIVVPNCERSDKHQVELAHFVKQNNYAESIDLHQLKNLDFISFINNVLEKKYDNYKKTEFFAFHEILEFFG